MGAIWGCDGEYTFYAKEKYPVSRAVLVDFEIPLEVKKRSISCGIACVEGYVGDVQVVSKVKKVDVLFLFDLLLHLVKPDWNEVLRLYSLISDHFIIFNPMRLGDRTVRLLDLGERRYFREICHSPTDAPYGTLFKDLNGIHPVHGIPNRDVFHIWQWGIADKSLRACVSRLGFDLSFREEYEAWGSAPNFMNIGYIFSRKGVRQR